MRSDFYYSPVFFSKKNSINPRVISQALRDLALKSPLWWGSSTKDTPASRDIKLFKENTIVFSHANTISADEMTHMGKLPSQGLVKFTQKSPNTYAINPISSASYLDPELTVNAYFLGYNGANQSSTKPAYIDIPMQAAENSFLFTGSLTGCSVIVTKHNDTTYRVYHDGRVNSSVLYDNVVMAFDFQDYQVIGTDEGLAMVYMKFHEGRWALILQLQQYEAVNGIPTPQRRIQDEPVILLYPDEAFYQSRLDKFNRYRSDIHQKLFNLAREIDIDTKNFKQGIYTDGDFSLDHPAILSWIELRNKIKKHLNIEREKIDIKIKSARDELIELQDKIKQSSKKTPTEEDSIRIDELKKTIELNRHLKEYYKQKYDVVLSESASVERSWLWLQIKNHDGKDVVLKIDEQSIKSGIQSESVSNREKYTVLLNNDIWNGHGDFKQGVKNYKELSITGFHDEMSASKMRALYIHGELSVKERGALSQYIQIKEQSEYVENILNHTLKTNTLFQNGGSIYQRLAPQDFYLPLMGDHEGGRCYPLVRAMSVALAQHDDVNGANALFNKLFIAAASPEEKNAILLKTSLQNLHFNTEAVGASYSIGLLNLKDIKKRVIESNGTQMYALNTQSHSMLIGKKVHNGEVRYCFYDPNFGLYIFDNPKKFSKCLDAFLIKEKMAYKYDALMEKSEPVFDLVSIDTEQMANVNIGAGIRVEDLVSSTELSEVIPRRQETRAFIENQNLLAKDRQIKSSLNILNAERWGSRLESSLDKITQKHPLDEYWLPVLTSTERLEDGRYKIQFVHKGDEEEARWIETDDKTFFEFKEYFSESIDSFSQHYAFKDLALQHEDIIGGGTEAEHVDGLNSAMGIKALIEWAGNRNRQSVASGNPSNLGTALKIHAYVSYTMMVHGAANDISRASRLASALWKEGAEIIKTEMNSFSSSILRTANEEMGTVFQGAMVGFDIYELANAENEQQRTVIGTQLAFDSAALGASAVGYGASLLGAETVAGVTMPLAVPLAGLGIGITELVKINEIHAQEAIGVGVIFGRYKEHYQNAAIHYDEEKKLLMPTEGIVIKEINFLNANFKLGSQYIYRGEERTWVFKHSTLSDFQSSPRADINKDEAINIREGVGISQDEVIFYPNKSNTIVLPVVPQCYLSYKYTSFFGGTTRGDYGFSVLRKMEENYQFYFDYFYCGLEYVISELKPEYVFTPISIILDSRNKHLIVPNMPKSWHGYIEHIITGNGGEYQISMNHGASLRLTQSPFAVDKSTWIIDTSSIDDHKDQVINVNDDNIQIGNSVIYVDGTATSSVIQIINSKHEIREVDFNNKTIGIVRLNGKQWNSTVHSIDSFLHDLAEKNELHKQYIIIDDYSVGGQTVGRAFYDVAAKHMLYTNSLNKENQSAILIATIEDIAYFYSKSENIIWSTHVNNGDLYASFNFYSFLGEDSNIERISIKNNTVIVELTNRKNGSDVNVVYHLVKNQLELVSISDDFILMGRLNKLDLIIPLEKHNYFLNHDYLVNKNYIRVSPDDKNVSPTRASPTAPFPKLAPIVMIKNTNYLGFQCIYWLRTSDGVIIKPNLARPDDYDQKMIANISQTMYWISTNPEELNSMNRRLANGEPFSHVLDPAYMGFTDKSTLLNIEGRFRFANTEPTLIKIVGACFNQFDPLTDTWNWKPPTDLILAGSLFDENGGEVFFFYSKESETIFRQEGLGQKDIDLKNPTAKRLSFSEIDTVFDWNGNLFVIHKNGVVKQLNANGSADIIAINKTWFEDESFNWRNLNDFINEPNPITLFGLKGKDGKQPLSAWYFKGKVIVSESLPSEDTLHFLDFDSSEGSGVIFDTKTKKLYQQTAISSALLADMFDDNQSLKPSENLPKLIELYPDVSLENVRKIGNGLMLSSSEGQLIFHSLSKNEPLGSSFIIKGTNNDDILAPTQLKDVQTLILSGGEGKDTYHLKIEDWQNHQVIIIDNQSQDGEIDHLVLPIKIEGNSIFVNRLNDDLILTDSINQTSLVLHNVYGTNSLAHQHLMIHFGDGVFNISELANEVTFHRGAMYLSSYFEERPQCNADLAYLAESCSQITRPHNMSYQPNEKLGRSISSSDIIPISTLQSKIH
ncbi:hypothetical protein GKR48_07045 [Providencia sp. wls1943]|uniref:TcdA/TcdB pore-forming domain-containing protein n=1 Tax=Providencia sp. wls1943 TaxID=2675150 RepID=UPI0012B67001|nr:TcdA/TcdB pore-forming domain-containing protein [Providencia sp. wls1943]MTB66580.1 hypothetical protein [Providencia sp. wls1943]